MVSRDFDLRLLPVRVARSGDLFVILLVKYRRGQKHYVELTVSGSAHDGLWYLVRYDERLPEEWDDLF